EELRARTGHPVTNAGCCCLCRYVPGGSEGPEMIQSDNVDVTEQRTQAFQRPFVAAATERVPVIDGVAPELPFGAEVVGRHSRDKGRTALFVQQEKFRIGPNIAGVERHEKRQIADQADVPRTGVFLNSASLAE